MKIIAYIQSAVFLAAFSLASAAFAQVYKCTFTDNQLHQNKVVYTDMPCGKTAKQFITDISEISKINVKNQSLVNSNGGLDHAVTQAVLNRNFALAKSLATSKEHWRLIAITENANPTATVSVNNIPAYTDQSNTDNACQRAQDDFNSTSQLYWRDKELVAAKKSVMYALCGVPEPMQQPVILRPVIIVQPYTRPHVHMYKHTIDGSPYTSTGFNSSPNPAQAYHRPLPHVNHYNGVQTGSFGQQSSRFSYDEPYSW